MTVLGFARSAVERIAGKSVRDKEYAAMLQAVALVSLAESFDRIATEMERRPS